MIKFWKYHWSELRERERESLLLHQVVWSCCTYPCPWGYQPSITTAIYFWKVPHRTWLLREEHHIVANLVGSLKCIQVVHRLKSQIALNAELAMWEWDNKNVTTWTSQFGKEIKSTWQIIKFSQIAMWIWQFGKTDFKNRTNELGKIAEQMDSIHLNRLLLTGIGSNGS
jgi:hypothetical protein